MYAIAFPAVAAAILFYVNASGGGTDIIAMILKKHTSMNIGTALLVVDLTSVVLAFFVFGPTTGLFSCLGLMAKSLVIDDVIENMNLCKCFNIVCDNPGPICDYIIKELNRSQAIKLRNYIRKVEPTAFILISNSSEIIGKGFLAN